MKSFLFFWLAVCSAGCNSSQTPQADNQRVEQPLAPAKALHAAMRAKRWTEARDHGLKALVVSPQDPDLLHQTAVATGMCGLKSEAAILLADAAKAANYQPASRVNLAVQAFIDVGQFYDAIDLLEQALEVDPKNGQHRRTLVGFLGEAERADLLTPHYRQLVQNRQFELPFLIGFTDTSMRRHSTMTVESMVKRNPNDHRVRLGLAQSLWDDRDFEAAEELLREILEHHPDFAPAHALLGQVLIADGREAEIPQWVKSQCQGSHKLSDHWLTLGDWASHHQLNAEAVRAYWEATRCDANDSKAWSRLVDSLRIIGANRTNGNQANERTAVTNDDVAESTLQFVSRLSTL